MQLRLDKIEKVLSFLDAEGKDLILLGDTNYDFGSKENDCLTQGDAKPEWPTNPGRPWITLDFVCPWKTLKLRPTPEKLCSEANFPCINFLACSAVAFFIPVMQGGGSLRLLGGVKTAHHLSFGKQPLFPSKDTKFHVKRRMKGDGYRQKIYM